MGVSTQSTYLRHRMKTLCLFLGISLAILIFLNQETKAQSLDLDSYGEDKMMNKRRSNDFNKKKRTKKMMKKKANSKKKDKNKNKNIEITETKKEIIERR